MSHSSVNLTPSWNTSSDSSTVPEFPFLKQIENYNCKISNSNNPLKTTWNIIENETHKKGSFKGIHLNIDGKLTNNYQTIVGSVNTLVNNCR